MSFSCKGNITENQKEKDSTHSSGDTFFDSLNNSKISQDIKNKVIITYKKENNFYLALKSLCGPNSDLLLLGQANSQKIIIIKLKMKIYPDIYIILL